MYNLSVHTLKFYLQCSNTDGDEIEIDGGYGYSDNHSGHLGAHKGLNNSYGTAMSSMEVNCHDRTRPTPYLSLWLSASHLCLLHALVVVMSSP